MAEDMQADEVFGIFRATKEIGRKIKTKIESGEKLEETYSLNFKKDEIRKRYSHIFKDLTIQELASLLKLVLETEAEYEKNNKLSKGIETFNVSDLV